MPQFPRRLAAPGVGLLALRRLIGIQRLHELPSLYLRNDLDERRHHDPGPQRRAQRGQQAERDRPERRMFLSAMWN